jgi:hypothetical protein
MEKKMKFKPIYDIQECRRPGIAFDIGYFNGRYIASGNTTMVLSLMQLNERMGYKFNCVFTLVLDKNQQKTLDEAITEAKDEALYSLGEQLFVEGTIILRMNPQMAHLVTQWLKPDCGLLYQFEMNWKGAEILRDMCLEAPAKELYVLGHRLQDLIETLQARQATWENREDDPPPKGYMAK